MYLLFSKLLPQLVYPMGLIFLLLVLILLLRRQPRIQTVLLWITLGVFLISSNIPFAQMLIGSLERRYPPLDESLEADLIIVLAGGEEPWLPPRPIPEINGAGDRFIYTSFLYQQGNAPKVLVSGGGIPWIDNSDPRAVQVASLLQIIGLPEEALILETRSRNTYENAVESSSLIRKGGYSKIMLVTSAYHMPRAVGAFEKQGIPVVPAPVDYQIADLERFTNPGRSWQSRVMDIMPSIEGMAITTRVVREYLGIWIYSLRGWM